MTGSEGEPNSADGQDATSTATTDAASSDEGRARSEAPSEDASAAGEARRTSASLLTRIFARDTRARRLLLAFGVWFVCLVVYGLVAGDRMLVHTKYNHFAYLADAWLHGRHDLGGMPPAHAEGNDWALFHGKWYVSFPPFPAMLMLPIVAIAGDPDNFRDAQFIVWLAGIGPAALFLVLEKLRRTGRSERTERQNVLLAFLFAFGTVYFFTAVQGSVWFAAHVVGVGLMALFVLSALDAKHPILAGLLIGLMFLTRVTTVLTAVFFAFEAIRVSYIGSGESPRPLPSEGPLHERALALFGGLDKKKLFGLVATFSLPVLGAIAFASWYNFARFGDPSPSAFGHEYLQVGWQRRIQTWGLFSYHYLGRNLSVMLAGLPWTAPHKTTMAAFGGVPFKINGHGLALWFTTPVYLWLLWPKRKLDWLSVGTLVAVSGPLIVNLLYQNSGWVQFGYRFSNDYAILLFVLLARGGRSLGRTFWLAAIWAVGWNLFGAVTFERDRAFYAFDSDHVYQPD